MLCRHPPLFYLSKPVTGLVTELVTELVSKFVPKLVSKLVSKLERLNIIQTKVPYYSIISQNPPLSGPTRRRYLPRIALILLLIAAILIPTNLDKSDLEI